MTRPNVLLLFSDQHNASVLGGHPDTATPALDRLAAGGASFSRAYCQNAICVPSRCSMLSGLYPRSFGSLNFMHRPGYHNRLAPCFAPILEECIPLQQHFHYHGYTTAAFGKRHTYEPCDGGWNYHASHLPHESPHDNYLGWVDGLGHAEAAHMDWAAEHGRGFDGQPRPPAPLGTRASALPDHATMEAFTEARTLDFLRERASDGNPFFCWASFYRPHQPYTPLESFWSRHDRSAWGAGRKAGQPVHMPETLRQDPATLPPFLRSWFQGRNGLWRLDLARNDEQLYRDYISAYCALVEELDARIGAILDFLDASGLARNTIVIYTCDHGDFVGAHGMVEKCSAGHNFYEETLRVPLLFRWPGAIPQGTQCAALTELTDLYPTLVELCQLPKPPQPLEGLSIAGSLSGSTTHQRPFTVSENWSQITIISPSQKLGRWKAPFHPELHFDFRDFGDMAFSDPLETQPIPPPPELAQQLDAWERTHPLRPPHIPEETFAAMAANKAAWRPPEP